MPLVTMMRPLGGLLQPQRDQQTNRDRKQMDEEVACSMNAVFGWMYIQHDLSSVCG